MIPVNVMAPTMQVACKAFIAPNSAARSPKERYTHVPRSPRRHARCFLVDCPTRGDGQDWDGSRRTAAVDAGPPLIAFGLARPVNTLVISLRAFCVSIYQGGTMSDVTIPGGKIRAFVERIENLDTELLELSEQKKEVFAEAKGEGFDIKILKEIIKLRKQDQEERDERESMLDLYMRAMEQAGPVAKAA